jgi:peptidoglycan-associated lipoprotein
MRLSALSVVVIAALAVSCGPKNVPEPPPPPPAPTPPPPAPTPEPTPEPTPDEYTRVKESAIDVIDGMGLFAEIHFDLDKSAVRDVDVPTLQKNADNLRKFDFLEVTIEGHCDERGTVEYNLALGERRAQAAYDYLISLGVAADRMKTISYGKEVPVCRDADESCWGRNRRARLTVTGKR